MSFPAPRLPVFLGLAFALALAGCTATDAPAASDESLTDVDVEPTTSTPVVSEPTTEPVVTPEPVEPEEGEVIVSSLNADKGRVAPGEVLHLTAGLEHLGGPAAVGFVHAYANGEWVGTVSFNLASQQVSTVGFSFRLDEPGVYVVHVTAENASVEIAPITVEVLHPGAFKLSDLRVSPAPIELGDLTVVSLVVHNDGSTDGSGTLRVLAGGVELALRPLQLAPDATQNVDIQVRPTKSGLLPIVVEVPSSTSEITGELLVRGPKLENATGEFNNGICDNYLGYTVIVDNAGDGAARNVVVTATLLKPDGQTHSTYVADPVTILAHQEGRISVAPLIEQRCGQDDTYQLLIDIQPAYGEGVSFDAGTFVV